MSGIEAIFGLASGAAGLTSLALQLCDYSLKLSRMYDDAKGAPETLRIVAADLNWIGLGLQQLERCRQESGWDSTFEQHLVAFRTRTTEIRTLVDEIAVRLEKYKRLRGIAFAIFKERDIADLISRLESSKQTLLLIFLVCDKYSQQQKIAQSNARRTAESNALATQLRDIQTQFSAQASNSQQILQQVSSLLVTSTSTSTVDQTIAITGSATCISDLNGTSTFQRPTGRRKAGLKKSVKIRIQLPGWLSGKVWDLSFDTYASGWNTTLNTYNIVPRKSEAFQLCRRGDLQGLRRLIDSGQASPLDCEGRLDEYNSLLVVSPISKDQLGIILLKLSEKYIYNPKCAAHSGQVHICRYLLDEATYPDQSLVMLLALGAFAYQKSLISLATGSNEAAENAAMYRMFFQDDRFDTTGWMHRGSVLTDFVTECVTAECFQILIQNLSPESDSFSPSSNAELGFELVSANPSEFLNMLGLQESDPTMATLRNRHGATILHYIAARLQPPFWVGQEQLDDWACLFTIALQRGADPHAMTHGSHKLSGEELPKHFTPFMTFLSRMEPLYIGIKIRLWAKIIHDAGLDLCRYAERETELWKQHKFLPYRTQSDSDSYDRDLPSMERLNYGPLPNDWNMTVSRPFVIEVYKLERSPGTYPIDLRIPQTIVWKPGKLEEYQGHWALVERREVCKVERNLGGEPQLPLPITEPPIAGTHDDTGFIVLLQERAARRRPGARRCTSQPRNISRREVDYLVPRNWGGHKFYDPGQGRGWVPDVHVCAFDGKWHAGRYSTGRLSIGYFGDHVSMPICNVWSCVQDFHIGHSFQESPGGNWNMGSFLADARDCREGRVGTMGLAEHTGTIACPRGCGRFDINKLNVPERMKAYHPWAVNEMSEFRNRGMAPPHVVS